MNINNKGLLLVFSTAIISGFSIFINKYIVSVINPYIFTFLKNAIVALLLTSIIFAVKDWKKLKDLTKQQWGLLILIGLVGGSIPFLFFFKGLSLTSAAQGSFIHKTMFVYVAVLAVIFLKEKIDKRFIMGALLLLVGNALLLKKLSFSFGKGDLLILIATLFWASENILSKYVLKDLSGKIVAWGRMFFGSLFILAFLISTSQINLMSSLNSQQIIWTLLTSALLFGYVITWYSGLKHVPVSVATAILVLGSPITTLLNLIVNNTINSREVLSGGLIIAGLVLLVGMRQILKLSSRAAEGGVAIS